MDAWIFPCLQALHGARPLDTAMLDFTLDVVQEMFAKAINRLEAAHLLAHLYGLRHGGASHDLLSRRRTLLEVKHRRRSATDVSLMRDAKATCLQKEMDKLPREVLALGNDVKDHFAEMITSTVRGLPLPIAVLVRPAAHL